MVDVVICVCEGAFQGCLCGTRHRDGHDLADAGQDTFQFGNWFGEVPHRWRRPVIGSARRRQRMFPYGPEPHNDVLEMPQITSCQSLYTTFTRVSATRP